MRRFEKYLDRAIKVAERLATSESKIDEKMKADISSFGTAILHNGLLPAIALFSDSSTDSGKRRVKLLNSIYYLLQPERQIPESIENHVPYLLNTALALGDAQHEKLRSDIMDAAMAMKLAIRTFELIRI